jgi:hypothetical protein
MVWHQGVLFSDDEQFLPARSPFAHVDTSMSYPTPPSHSTVAHQSPAMPHRSQRRWHPKRTTMALPFLAMAVRLGRLCDWVDHQGCDTTAFYTQEEVSGPGRPCRVSRDARRSCEECGRFRWGEIWPHGPICQPHHGRRKSATRALKSVGNGRLAHAQRPTTGSHLSAYGIWLGRAVEKKNGPPARDWAQRALSLFLFFYSFLFYFVFLLLLNLNFNFKSCDKLSSD